MEILLSVFLAIPLGLIPAFIAKNKGHSFGLWWFYGWALFIVAIIHVFFIEDRMVVQNSNYNSFNVAPTQYTSTFNQNMTGSVQRQPLPSEVAPAPIQKDYSGNKLDSLRSFKELLDVGAITQEEFDAKKKQILGL